LAISIGLISLASEASAQASSNFTSAPEEVQLSACTDFEPFVDPDLPDGGVITALVAEVFLQAGYRPTMSFAAGERKHHSLLSALFPYPRSEAREAEYFYSTPLVDFSVLPYWHAGSAVLVSSLADLAGMRVCSAREVVEQAARSPSEAGAPAFSPLHDSLAGCFQGLIDRTVDVVLAEPSLASEVIRYLGIRDDLRTSNTLIDLGSLHVLIPRFSAYGSAMLYRFNEALDRMRQSGETDAFVKQHELRDLSMTSGSTSATPKPEKAGSWPVRQPTM
jgi:polar amino acid transport system substrate-binding protein